MIKRIHFSFNESGEPLTVCPYNKMVRVPVTHVKVVPYVGTFACGSCPHNMDEGVCNDGETLEDDDGWYTLCDHESFSKEALDDEPEAMK